MNEQQRPLIYSHRGASAYAPENTLSAFRLAAELGADGIEFDVKVTRDGRVIVLHDQTLDRTTSGSGNFKNYDFDDLRKLDAGIKFPDKFRNERIPTLEEVFEAVGGRLSINIELTNYATPGDDLIEKIAAILEQVDDHSKIMFSSFNWGNLKKARNLCPDIPCGLLAMPGIAGWFSRSFLAGNVPHEAIHPYFSDVNVNYVTRIHQQGKKVNVWTINDPEEMLRLMRIGVDMIMTDDPPLAIKTLRVAAA
jgi:glycerophosphoryl diester phosphodiesterase